MDCKLTQNWLLLVFESMESISIFRLRVRYIIDCICVLIVINYKFLMYYSWVYAK